LNGAAHDFYQIFNNCQSQSGAAIFTRGGTVCL